MSWEKILSFAIELLASLGLRLLTALFVLVVGLRVISWIKKKLRKSHKMNELDAGVRSFTMSFTSIALYILLVITIASVLGVPATSFITVLASCGVAIGLALQGSLSNVAGGLMILLFKPFKVGDFIEAAGESGAVTGISVVYTELLTPDNKRLTIPNGTLTNSVIKNYSAEKTRRVDLTFRTDYVVDVEKVKDLLLKTVQNHELVLKDPEPFVGLSEHGDSSLTYVVRAWSNTEDYWKVYFDLTESVKKLFDENGISIPYPQMDVHMKN